MSEQQLLAKAMVVEHFDCAKIGDGFGFSQRNAAGDLGGEHAAGADWNLAA